MSKLPAALQPTEEDIQTLLAAQVHLGSKNAVKAMEPYVYKRRPDGIHILNIFKTWEKIVFAARVIVAIENPEDIVIISSRNYGQRAALKFASYTGAKAIAGRFTPGTFTNYITRGFKEPRLVIVTDPRTDSQAIIEASYVNIPTIALADSDSPLKLIDIAIPGNNKGKHSLGVIYWMLAREVLRLRGTIPRNQPWGVMTDMFFFRDADEQAEKNKDDDFEETVNQSNDAAWDAAGGNAANSWDQPTTIVAGTEDWSGAAPVGEWGAEPVPAVPAASAW